MANKKNRVNNKENIVIKKENTNYFKQSIKN